jgi:ATP-dependent helicase HrpB
MPEFDWPSFDPDDWADLIAQACAGKKSEAEVAGGALLAILKGRLTYAQNQRLDEQVPEALAVPSGNRIKLDYQAGGPPVLAVRLQELFGWPATPRIAGGRVPVLLHLLGPNYRPVQITDDLASFWANAYFQVRKANHEPNSASRLGSFRLFSSIKQTSMSASRLQESEISNQKSLI